MKRVVGIGEYIISDRLDDVIKTYALGSCVGLTIYSPIKKVAGMAHIVLPESSVNREESVNRPGYFADTAIPLLINKMCNSYGCSKENLIVNIFGGAQSVIKDDIFNIGKKNVSAVMNVLKTNNIKCNFTQTGGCFSRTLEIDVATGEPKVYSNAMKIQPIKEVI